MTLILLMTICTYNRFIKQRLNFYTVIERCQGRASYCFNKKISSKYTRFLSNQKITVFLKIIFIIFRFFSRKQNKCLRLCYFSVFWFSIVSLKFQINDDFHFNFTLLQKCLKSFIPIFISSFYQFKPWTNSKISRYKLYNMGTTTQQKRFTFSTYKH